MGFRAYQIAIFLGVVASQMFSVAMGWLIYDRTSSALHLGYVGLAQFLPALLFAPLAGHLADRFPRSRLYLLCLVGFSVAAAACAFSPGPLYSYYVALTGIGLLRSLEAPASSALLPQLVDNVHLPRAVASISSTKQIANVLGPALGGLAYATFGGGAWVFALSASFAFLAGVVASRIPTSPVRPGVKLDWENVLAGARYIRGNRVLCAAMSLDMFAVLLGGAVALLPVYARDILFLGPQGLGWLRSAPAAGSLLMALWLVRHPIESPVGKKLFGAVFVFGAVTVVMGLSRDAWLTGAALLISGAANVLSVIIRQTLIQLRTPDEMRGRVSAVNQVFNLSSNQLGEFESGLTASWWGPVGAVLFGGIGTMVVAGTWARAFPELRQLEKFEGKHGA